jgi:tellurite resistance protein TerC
VTRRSGRRMLTPLFLALAAIGTTDLLFAFDSIPAVFGVTDHGYIVFAANAFALLGLRPLYFLVSGMLSRLVYLSTGLALILAFIGAKLILEFVHQRNPSIAALPTVVSLAVIVAVLVATTIASVIKSKRDPASRADAGALRQGTDRGDAPDAVRPERPGSDEVKPVA